MSSEKIAELEKAHRSLRDKHQTDRVKTVIVLAKGWAAAQVRWYDQTIKENLLS